LGGQIAPGAPVLKVRYSVAKKMSKDAVFRNLSARMALSTGALFVGSLRSSRQRLGANNKPNQL
jgi:hypothetical protein